MAEKIDFDKEYGTDSLIVKYKGKIITQFSSSDSIKNFIDYVNAFSEDEMKDVEITTVSKLEKLNKIGESIVEDIPNKQYTIWSSSDFSDNDEQIPLVTIKLDDNGEVEDVVAMSNSNFDLESKKIADNSLKATEGKPLKDRLLRVDKSVNHSDPFFSTEIQRYNIKADKGNKKTDIRDIVDVDNLSDEIDGPRDNKPLHKNGILNIANQILITNRDDLKAAANLKSATEDSLTKLFSEITGVDYYTEEIVDDKQYNYLLDLLGRSSNKYDDSHLSPKENEYVLRLKDLTEDLIEKVILKNDKDFYDFDKKEQEAQIALDKYKNEIKSKVDDTMTEDDIEAIFEDSTGVNYSRLTVEDEDKYNKFLNSVDLAQDTLPSNNRYVLELQDSVYDIINR